MVIIQKNGSYTLAYDPPLNSPTHNLKKCNFAIFLLSKKPGVPPIGVPACAENRMDCFKIWTLKLSDGYL